jgi:Bacterial protein of unknown function (DUF937)
MSLFDEFLGAVNNPGQQASVDQLGSLVGAVQQLSGQSGIDPGMMQTVMSMVGGQMQSSLQEQQSTMGADHVNSLVNQLGAGGTNNPAMGMLFPPQVQQQLAGQISQRTGLDSNMIMGLLPMLVPIAMQFLQGGAMQSSAAAPQSAGNPLLNMFLDKNNDGNLDLGDAMGLAAQFMQNR